MAYAIKAEVRDPRAKVSMFTAQKTMYGGKQIAEGDTISCSLLIASYLEIFLVAFPLTVSGSRRA